MIARNSLLLLGFGFWVNIGTAQQAPPRPMQIKDLFALDRVSDPQISPDGKMVAYVVSKANLKKNSLSSDIWLVSTDKGSPKQLTTFRGSDWHPRWSPDSRQILFTSRRSGQSQLWLMDLQGGEARQLTDIATGAGGGIWSPDGKWIAFVSAVYPEYAKLPYKESNAKNKKRLAEMEKNPVKARVFDGLFFRHWDSYVKGKRQHLFVIPASGGEPRDVTPLDRDAVPTSFTFAMGDDFTFTPDSQSLLFTAPPEKNEAWSTNYDICRVPISGGKVECLTKSNLAADGAPQFSPDGKWLAFRAQKTPKYEADRWQLYLVDARFRGIPISFTSELDSSVDSFVWAPDSQKLYFLAEEKGREPVYSVSLKGGKIKKVIDKHRHRSLSISNDGKLALSRAAMTFPAEVFVNDLQGHERNVSQANADLLAKLDLPSPESVTVPGADGTPMQMWILKPPGFQADQKWPLVYLVHGGPQGAWTDSWSFRWNPQIWAAQGYVVALPNPRGSTGFGQKYVKEISGDWGGKCFQDLMKGVDYLEKQPYIDKTRMGAAGASFGGYMMNWFQGHTDRFDTLITHCGVYNLDSMYGGTEELWFVEWDLKGTPWNNRESYRKFSPHLYAKNFKTPMLIIHGDLDFRVPVSEGLQLFTTLQRLNVPSRMINFPDEGHWVNKPRNSEFWHRQVFAWLKKYVPPGGVKR